VPSLRGGRGPAADGIGRPTDRAVAELDRKSHEHQAAQNAHRPARDPEVAGLLASPIDSLRLRHTAVYTLEGTPARAQIVFHSSSVTGWTESLWPFFKSAIPSRSFIPRSFSRLWGSPSFRTNSISTMYQ